MLPGRTRRIAALLAAATLVPIVALTWLGVRLLQQDRDLERQRIREWMEVAAGRAAVDIERQLLAIEERLAGGFGIRLLPAAVEAAGEERVLYQPDVRSTGHTPQLPEVARAERAEFQHRDLRAAAAAYRRLAESPDRSLRAAALVGLARVLRRNQDHAGALGAYVQLQDVGDVLVAGQPAALVGYQGRCKVLDEAANSEALRECAAALADSLGRGEWRVDRSTFELYRDLLEGWNAPAFPDAAVARTEVALDLWRAWRAGHLAPRGRRVVHQDGIPVLAVWTGGPERPVLWLATGAELDASWRALWEAQGLTVSLADTEGRTILGTPPAGGVTLTPGQSRLPFILSASGGSDNGASGGMPRAALAAGLLLACLLTLGAAYGVYKTTTRELLLARQQSDFVSAVSHEFRTPLTSMRHLTDLLVRRDNLHEDRRAHYYALLTQETERLHRMVEGLLSFGRIDAGAYVWQLEPVDVSRMLADALDEFRREPIAAGRELLLHVEPGVPPISADREALSRAVWNLLENAGKYSAPGTPVTVFARRQQETVLIGVGDEGSGIPHAEQDSIFQKFVRGTDARRSGIRGVGMGLTLVKRIVEAHGGSVQLQTEPGRGSTFTMVMPCREC